MPAKISTTSYVHDSDSRLHGQRNSRTDDNDVIKVIYLKVKAFIPSDLYILKESLWDVLGGTLWVTGTSSCAEFPKVKEETW
ncbi:unnamed protein product [Rhizophagus irregularis]|nr:unnamed protein product [Rhizophagus irregularis]